MSTETPGHQYYYQIISGILYLFQSEYTEIAFESENFEDVFLKNQSNSYGIGEAKSITSPSKKKWGPKGLFFSISNGTASIGPIMQLIIRYLKFKEKYSDSIELIFFSSIPVSSKIYNSHLNRLNFNNLSDDKKEEIINDCKTYYGEYQTNEFQFDNNLTELVSNIWIKIADVESCEKELINHVAGLIPLSSDVNRNDLFAMIHSFNQKHYKKGTFVTKSSLLERLKLRINVENKKESQEGFDSYSATEEFYDKQLNIHEDNFLSSESVEALFILQLIPPEGIKLNLDEIHDNDPKIDLYYNPMRDYHNFPGKLQPDHILYMRDFSGNYTQDPPISLLVFENGGIEYIHSRILRSEEINGIDFGPIIPLPKLFETVRRQLLSICSLSNQIPTIDLYRARIILLGIAQFLPITYNPRLPQDHIWWSDVKEIAEENGHYSKEDYISSPVEISLKELLNLVETGGNELLKEIHLITKDLFRVLFRYSSHSIDTFFPDDID